MAHDLTQRTHRFHANTPKLGAEDVFGHYVDESETRRAYAAIKKGDQFHALLCEGYEYSSHDGKTVEYSPSLDGEGVVYGPVHESMTIEDVEGATYAHDDGTHWHFAHCSPAEQLDLAAEAEAFAVQQFAEAIQETVAAGALADGNAARNTHHAKATDLRKFARIVGRRVHEVILSETLGHYHRNPHEDHKRLLTADAIARQLQVLRQNSEADADSRAMHARVSEAAGAIRTRLTATAKIETRAERVQRFIRLSARGQDPLGGKEYIFTSHTADEDITGAANLPDPSWPFDKAELAKGITRGTHIYYDGIPGNISPNRPYAVRFSRPKTGGAWTQGERFRIYG